MNNPNYDNPTNPNNEQPQYNKYIPLPRTYHPSRSVQQFQDVHDDVQHLKHVRYPCLSFVHILNTLGAHMHSITNDLDISINFNDPHKPLVLKSS